MKEAEVFGDESNFDRLLTIFRTQLSRRFKKLIKNCAQGHC
jgi:hypothetical protein